MPPGLAPAGPAHAQDRRGVAARGGVARAAPGRAGLATIGGPERWLCQGPTLLRARTDRPDHGNVSEASRLRPSGPSRPAERAPAAKAPLRHVAREAVAKPHRIREKAPLADRRQRSALQGRWRERILL